LEPFDPLEDFDPLEPFEDGLVAGVLEVFALCAWCAV
jgi:hypothetical protein